MSLPYENASSGKSAIDDMAKLLRVFGASSFGTMEDFAAGKVIVQFEHRGRRVSIEASFWGYAAAWKRAHPYTSRSRRDRGRYEALALKRGEVAVWSILRDWLKGQLTAIEVGMQSFESAFLAQLTLPTGETVMQRLVESKQLMLQVTTDVWKESQAARRPSERADGSGREKLQLQPDCDLGMALSAGSLRGGAQAQRRFAGRDGGERPATFCVGVWLMWTEDKWQTMLRQQWQCQQAVDRYNESQRKRARPMSEWGIVDLFGRQTLVGLVSEVERFGVKMLAIEVLFNGALLPVAYFGGAAIYGFVPCSEEVARKRGATARYDLTPSIAATAPLTALDPPPGVELESTGSGTNDYPGESQEAPDGEVRRRLREPYYAELRRQSEEDDILF